MKKLIFTFLALVIPHFCFSQYISLFGSSSTAWKIVTTNLWGTGTDSLRAKNDTLINNLQYKQIISDYMVYNPQHIHGFVRENTVNGKAWYKGWYSSSPPLGDSTERLIMDMALAVGDSFYFTPYFTPFPLDTGWLKVDSVYYLSGIKYIRFVDTTATYWGGKLLFIEGVGPSLGIQYLSEPSNTNPYLLCYYRNNQKLYSNGNPNFKECDLLTDIIETTDSKQLILISPHPVVNTSIFQFSNPTLSLCMLNIYDVYGRIIKQYSSAGNNIIIQNSSMLDGIYYYRLSLHNQEEKNIASGKILFVRNLK